MKRLILVCLIILTALSGKSQQKAIISGRLLNGHGKSIELLVNGFNNARMQGPGDLGYNKNKRAIKAVATEDSLYYIEIPKLSQPFTPCQLRFGNKQIGLILSPGDSLVIDLDYWLFQSNEDWVGIGAARNIFHRKNAKAFEGSGRKDSLNYFQGQQRFDKEAELRDDKGEFLQAAFLAGLIDSSYYDWERKLIYYNYCNSIVRHGLWYRDNVDSSLLDRVAGVFEDLDLNDDEAFESIQSYRSLIKSYLSFIVYPNGPEGKWDLGLILYLAHSRLEGEIRSYYLWYLAFNEIKAADTKVEKELVWQYFWDNVQDLRVKNLLMEEKTVLEFKSSQNGSNPPLAFYFTMVILLAILLLIILFVIWQLRKAAKKEVNYKEGLPMALLIVFILFASVTPVLNFIISHKLREVWPLLSGISVLAFYFAQAKLLMRYYFNKKKYFQYTIAQVLLAAAYFIVLNLILRTYGEWPDAKVGGVVLRSWALSLGAVILISQVVNYLEGLFEQKKGFRYLLEQIVMNLEFLIHVILLAVVYSFLGTHLDSDIGVRNMVLFFMTVGVFYLNVFWLVPKYQFTQRYLKLILLTLAFVGLTGLLTSVIDAIYLTVAMQHKGIYLGFINVIMFPGVNWAIYLVAIPAMIYALIRKGIISRNKEGFTLFRKKEAELNQLRAQVNPHFLFNSLNTVYAFALKEGNDKTAESIAKLANMMRYLIDDMEQAEIPIRKEIGYIEDYIQLQSIRSSVERNISVQIDLSDDQLDQMIAPMLMIPFVENAFKHGINPNNPSELKIWISINSKSLQFEIENSINQDFESFKKEKGFGIGIQNVRKRLELVYPGRHKLSITDAEERFEVIMTIEL
ncbi:MAG: histidine kinase [Bacteroidota bacterium]|nr:histidine kinase [Bacteroidota bacterium]